MAYDEALAQRIRSLTEDVQGVTERKMFGGLAFLVNGNMAIAASGHGGLLIRLDPDQEASLLSLPAVQLMEMRGRPMHGWLRVSAEAVATEPQLAVWVDRGIAYASGLPAKA